MSAAVKTVMTSLPGKVVSYDSTTQRATVEPTVHNGNPLPPIPDVPVKWPRFGSYRLIGPLQIGNEVTLHFYKWDPSRFRVSGEKSASNHTRDTGIYAIAVPGSEAETNPYDDDGGSLHLGSTISDIVITESSISLKTDIVNLSSDAPSDAAALASQVDQLFTTLKSAISSGLTAVGAGGAANGATGASTFNSAFNPTSVASPKVKID